MLLNPQQSSYNQILSQLESWVTSNSAIPSFYTGDAGLAILQLFAGIGALNQYSIITALREKSIIAAKIPSSVLDIAISLGYNTNRKTTPIIAVTIFPTTSRQIYNNEPLAILNNNNLTSINNISITAGIPITINCGIGNYNSATILANTVIFTGPFAIVPVTLTSPYIADNNIISVSVNNNQLTPQTYVENMSTSTDVTVSTAINGNLELVFGDGVSGYLLNPTDTIVVTWFETNGLFTDTTLSFNPVQISNPEMTSTAILTRGTNEDSVEKIRVLSPRYYVTLRRAVTPNDYIAIAQSAAGVISAGISTFGNTITIAILKEDLSLLTSYEITTITNYILKFSMFNQPVTLVNSVPIYVTTIINLDVITTSTENYILDIITILSGYANMNAIAFHILDVENLIYQLPGVKRVTILSPNIDYLLAFNQYFVFNSPIINVNYNNNILVTSPAVSSTPTGYSN